MKSWVKSIWIATLFLVVTPLSRAGNVETGLRNCVREALNPFFVPTSGNYKAVQIQSIQHDPQAFTQGLYWDGEVIFESTGLYGESSIRRINSSTGEVLQKVDLPPQYFGEGTTLLDGKLYQLTWKEQTGFIYDPKTLKKTGQFAYSGEGWGLTHDGTHLIMSNGSSEIRYLDPQTFEVVKTIHVRQANGRGVDRLNELQYVNREILANIWQSDKLVRINPLNGDVLGFIDASAIAKPYLTDPNSVLNGIAYDATTQRLWITGKKWPKLFEIKLQSR